MAQFDEEAILKILEIGSTANQENLGDVLGLIIRERQLIQDEITTGTVEGILTEFRGLVARAEQGWRLFEEAIVPTRELSDLEKIQLFGLERASHELCFAFENLEYAAGFTWGGVTGTRFYLNSIYHYLNSMFLIDEDKNAKDGFSFGGKVIRVLEPLGLKELLNPIMEILNRPIGKKTLGQTILLLRHSDLVHGDYSPERIEYLIQATDMRNNRQQREFNKFLWDLFYELLRFQLRLISLFTHLHLDFEKVLREYLKSKLGSSPQS